MGNYWVVGAMWGGHDDQYEKFVRRGYWFLGWSNEQQPAQAQLRNQIKPGDRIAIKKKLGQGERDIQIRAIGVVQEVDPDDKRVYVNWLLTGLDRRVPSRGFFSSIHGPLTSSDEWVRTAFLL